MLKFARANKENMRKYIYNQAVYLGNKMRIRSGKLTGKKNCPQVSMLIFAVKPYKFNCK